MIDTKTLKTMQNLRKAERQRKETEQLEAVKKQERAVQQARHVGYQRGEASAAQLIKMIEHPVAKLMMEQAGRELGRLVAEKAEEEGTPGLIAFECAQAVWDYIQKTGAPLEHVIKAEIYYRMECMDTVLQIDVPAMTFKNQVDDLAMRRLV